MDVYLTSFLVHGYINMQLEELLVLKARLGQDDIAFKSTFRAFTSYVQNAIIWGSIDKKAISGTDKHTILKYCRFDK